MALCEVGTIVRPGATGSQTYSTSEQVKAIELYFVNRAGNGGGSANAIMAHGIATYRGSTAVQRYFGFASEDNIGTSDVYVGAGTADIIKATNGTTNAVNGEIAFVSFGASSGFTLNWQALPTTASVEVYYIAWCGPLIADAIVGQINTATGTQTVTLPTGFGRPDLVKFPLNWNGTDPPATGHGDMQFGFGVRSGSANGRCIRWGSQDNAGTQATNQAIYNNRAMAIGDNAAIEWAFQMAVESSWPTDGFALSWVTNTITGFPIHYLALRFTSDVVVTPFDGQAPTSGGLPVVQSFDTGGTPELLHIFHTRQTTVNTIDTTSTDAAAWGVGMVDGAGTERYMGGYDDDAQGTASVTGTSQTSAKVIQTWLPSTNALDGEADGLVSSPNFNLSWNDLPPSAIRYTGYTIGSIASDVTAPVVTLSSSSTHKMSDETGKDSYSYSFSADENIQAWKIKVVSNDTDVHTDGTQVESGGSVSASTPVTGTITYAELVAAGMGAEGTKRIKVFVQDIAGNWSSNT